MTTNGDGVCEVLAFAGHTGEHLATAGSADQFLPMRDNGITPESPDFGRVSPHTTGADITLGSPDLVSFSPSSPFGFVGEQAHSGVHTERIKVCARVRPFSHQELEVQEACCIAMPSVTEAVVTDVLGGGTSRSFVLDRAFWSFDSTDAAFATQQVLTDELGAELLGSALQGFNTCLLVAGDARTGKTYSLLGSAEFGNPMGRGVLPSLADAIFEGRGADSSVGNDGARDHLSCSLTCLEVHGNHMNDLLRPVCDAPQELVTRWSPQVGAYVQGLEEVPVFSAGELHQLLDFALRARAAASSCLSHGSSRPHCLYTLELVLGAADGQQLRSRLSFVDLGSSTRPRCEQAKSLGSLLQVVEQLSSGSAVDQSLLGHSPLSSLLQEPLYGNCKTIALAALSPAASDYDRSMRTMRIAESLGNIVTRPVANSENANELISRLQYDCDTLRRHIATVAETAVPLVPVDTAQLSVADDLAAIEELLVKYGRDADARHRLASDHEARRKEGLSALGLFRMESLDDYAAYGLEESTPRLVNASEDASLAGKLVYFLPQGVDVTLGSSCDCLVPLGGIGVLPLMATVRNEGGGRISLRALTDGRVLVNGWKPEALSVELAHGDRFILGHSSCLRLVIPGTPEAVGNGFRNGDRESLAYALAEVDPEHSDAYRASCSYAERIRARAGDQRAEEFLVELRQVAHVVDEANAIAKALWPEDGLEFAAEAVVDLLDTAVESAQCVVRLRRWKDPDAFRQRCDAQASHTSFVCVNRGFPDSSESWQSRPNSGVLSPVNESVPSLTSPSSMDVERAFTTVAMFSCEAFLRQIDSLREAHDVQQRKDAAEVPELPRFDIDVTQELSGSTTGATSGAGALVAARSGRDGSASWKLDQLERRHELERCDWQEAMRLKDVRIHQLEKQVAEEAMATRRVQDRIYELEAQVASLVTAVQTGKAALSPSPTTQTASSDERGEREGGRPREVEDRVRAASQKTAASALVVARLLSNLQEMKRELAAQSADMDVLRGRMGHKGTVSIPPASSQIHQAGYAL